jgi:hypothetical protein
MELQSGEKDHSPPKKSIRIHYFLLHTQKLLLLKIFVLQVCFHDFIITRTLSVFFNTKFASSMGKLNFFEMC